MAAKTQLLQFKQIVRAPAAEVYRAFTRSTALREWFCNAAEADPRPGGRIYLWWHSGYYASGEFTRLTPDKKVVFTWLGKAEPATTKVTVALAAKGDATRVTVTHGDIGTGRAWAPVVSEFTSGWKMGLENLVSTLEAGPDLRLVRRPMLGVNGLDLTDQLAASIGAPVSLGLRINGVLAGMAAQQAGLQSGDIVTQIAGRKVTGFDTLAAALQGRQAGDVVAVGFYRGKEKKTLQLTLSPRPQPRVPATAGEMADMAREFYAEQEAELIKAFEGTTEEAASRRRAAGEWNAKDILAHLILSAQATFRLIEELVAGDQSWNDGQGDNIQAPLTALASIYRTAPELMEKLRYTEAEVVALLREMPPEFVARKSSYWRVAYEMTDIGLHYREHIVQLRATLKPT